MEIKWNLKFAYDENIFKCRYPNGELFQCNNSQNFCYLDFIYSGDWVFNLTMSNGIYTWMTSQRIAELQTFICLVAVIPTSVRCFAWSYVVLYANNLSDQPSLLINTVFFCVNRKFNMQAFETLASWYFKNEEIGESVLIIIHIGLLTIMTLASTICMYFSPQFWPFNIYTGYNHRQNVRLDCSLICLCVIIRRVCISRIPTFKGKGTQI